MFPKNPIFFGSLEIFEIIELITKKASPAPKVSIGFLVSAGGILYYFHMMYKHHFFQM